MDTSKEKQELDLYLISPRGFCAGVERAIEIVEQSLAKWGPPIYVRHEIVHNKFVVDSLREKGVVFVNSLDECPDDRPVILSAHGVAKSVITKANSRNMNFFDAICPLVSKVHVEVQKNHRDGLQNVMIGHSGHPETLGTLGQLSSGEILLVETVEDVEKIVPIDPGKVAYVTQTTLSIDDIAPIITALKKRFPNIKGPHKSDICYATTNRQEAVKKAAPFIECLFVIGSTNSSNTKRLVEVGIKSGCAFSILVSGPEQLDLNFIKRFRTIGLTSGASAPEILVERCQDYLRKHFNLNFVTLETIKENVSFNLPRELRAEVGQ